MRIITIIILLFSFISGCDIDAYAQQKRDINKIKKEQQTTKKEIAETSKKITANTKETNKMLSRLNSLSAEATEKKVEVEKLQSSVDSIDRDITIINDSISVLDQRIESLRNNYAKSLRSMQGNFGSMNALAFIFSSESFSKAWQRLRYMQQMGKWRKQRTQEIKSATDSLTHIRLEMDSMQNVRRKSVAQLSLSQKQLEAQKNETNKLVSQLKKEGSSLKALLKEKEKKAKALDGELDRLIAEEQKRAEKERKEAEKRQKESERKKSSENNTSNASTTNNETKASNVSSEAAYNVAESNRILTGNFESNKGKLLFPVTGKYRVVRGFGRQKHPELEHVETDNAGIDIEAVGGGAARAVFAGKVSEIFKQPGYNTIVMVRHGSYLTIYANLSSISVKKGDEIKAGQSIGTIYADPEENGASILHFELRKERNKLNPLDWVS